MCLQRKETSPAHIDKRPLIRSAQLGTWHGEKERPQQRWETCMEDSGVASSSGSIDVSLDLSSSNPNDISLDALDLSDSAASCDKQDTSTPLAPPPGSPKQVDRAVQEASMKASSTPSALRAEGSERDDSAGVELQRQVVHGIWRVLCCIITNCGCNK